jgi:hypothetical protein
MLGGTYFGAAPVAGLLLQPTVTPSDGSILVTHTWVVVRPGRTWVETNRGRTWAIPDEEP